MKSKLMLSLAILTMVTASTIWSDDAISTQIESLKTQLKLQSEQLQKLENQSHSVNRNNRTTIGGYGEMVYTAYRHNSSQNQADLKRFVIFLGHQFNDQLSFNSEVDWEHAITSADDSGATEIEMAYLTYQHSPKLAIKTGLFLMPFGFLNQSHEPPVFYGVKRNEVETRIIPTTWREGGIALSGNTNIGLNWEVGITTGFDLAKFDDNAKPLHASHQELQLAKANDLSYYGAANYKKSGLTAGSAIFMGNSLHSNADYKADDTLPNFAGLDGKIVLWDLHARYQKHGWDIQAIYAQGSIDDAREINTIIDAYNIANTQDRPSVPSEFYGWLVQGAYQVWHKGEMSLTPFVRIEQFNTQSKMPNGFMSDSENRDRVLTVGVSFKPHNEVVVKADYQKYEDNTANDRFNLGIGYMF